MAKVERCRFAPSTTGRAHLGTLLAGLLAWLDARSRGASFLLRLEDLDRARCRADFARDLTADLTWLGLDFDAVVLQHQNTARHHEALDRLEALGLLYPCSCSRALVRAHGVRAADGGYVYPGTCRGRDLPPGGWRAAEEALRFRLPEGPLLIADEGEKPRACAPLVTMGDPVVRRKDGTIAYQLAVVVDDGDAGITRVVRGRDLLPSTPLQVALLRALGLPTPVYRHHLLLLEVAGEKLAKAHGSLGLDELARVYDARRIVGFLAYAAGLLLEPRELLAHELLPGFSFDAVAREDRVVASRELRLLA